MLTKDAILQGVQSLPPDEQEQLIGEMLAMLPFIAKPPAHPNSARLAGIFANEQPPPSDAQVQQWLDEHPQGRYEQP